MPTRRIIRAATLIFGVAGVLGPAVSKAQLGLTNYTFLFNVSAHFNVTNDGGVASKLDEAAALFQTINASSCNPSDARTCISLSQSGGTLSFGTSGDGLDIVSSQGELDAVFAAFGNIKIVTSLGFCKGTTGSYTGCTQAGTRNTVSVPTANSRTFAHEFGHAQGLPDNSGCSQYIMYGVFSTTKNVVTPVERDAFYVPNSPYVIGTPCSVPLPSVFHSYFVPQSGQLYSSPVEGEFAIANFRGCPNNDGGSSFFSKARIKVVVKDSNGAPIAGLAANDVYLRFNGGTPVQGYSGVGADSIIANSNYNFTPLCPNVQSVPADGPTNASGETYITFAGPGGNRDAMRKWGHYDTEIPVYVLGIKLDGRYTSNDLNGTYQLRVKSFDWSGGLLGSHPADDNVGEWVDPGDYNGIANGIGVSSPVSYWKDFDSSGDVGPSDFNMIVEHAAHNCDTPQP